MDTDLLAGTALYLKDCSSEQHVDFFVVKQIQKSGANVRIFATCELRFGFDHGHLRSEPPHCLRQFKADVASADHDELTRQTVEIERGRLGDYRVAAQQRIRTAWTMTDNG